MSNRTSQMKSKIIRKQTEQELKTAIAKFILPKANKNPNFHMQITMINNLTACIDYWI